MQFHKIIHLSDRQQCFFSLKQHNRELKGGAKASSAGRPWILACLVRGFKDRSEGKWESCPALEDL